MNKPAIITIALAAAMATASAFAQQSAADSTAAAPPSEAPVAASPATTATLRVDHGKVMLSDGGEFITATTGTAVEPGERLMLSEGSAATVTYSNRCKRKYSDPGLYVIDDESTCKAAPVSGNNTGVAIGVAAAATAIGVAAGGGGGDDNDTPPPVSR